MFVSSQHLYFPIPLKNITISELQLIERIDDCRNNNQQLLGQAKLSDRQTVIIMSYLISTLFLNNLRRHPYFIDRSQGIKRQEQHLKTFIYLCKSQKRKFELFQMGKKIYNTIKPSLLKIRRQNNRQGRIENEIMLQMYVDSQQSQYQHQQMSILCKQNGQIFKRMYFTTTKKFMEYKIRRKQDLIWKKIYQFGCQTDYTIETLNFINKKTDYLFIQHNDIENILEEAFTINLLDINLHRAHIEIRKLNKYYNFRQQVKRSQQVHNKSKSIENRKESERPQKSQHKINKEPLKQQNQKRQQSNKKPSSSHKKSIQKPKENSIQQDKIQQQPKIQINNTTTQQKNPHHNPQQQKIWNVKQFDKKFLQLYKYKKQLLLSNKGGYTNTSLISIQKAECFYLMNLHVINYFISFLVVQWANNKYIQNSQILNSFINILYTNTRITSSVLRKLRRVFLAFTKKYPPKIKGKVLSFVYIDQLLYFFEKGVLWNQIFCKQSISSSVLIKSQSQLQNHENIINTRFIVARQRRLKDSNLKITTFDQRIFFQILAQSAKNFTILSNLAPSLQFYDASIGNFKPKGMLIHYRSPCSKAIADQYKYSISGFIVSSTPNQQDLHIMNQRQQQLTKDLYDINKKQDIQHYNQILRSYGVLVHDICELVSDGVIVYFPNKDILRECRNEWELRQNIYQRINRSKKIFQQNQWEAQNIKNVYNFRRCCKLGRGAIYFLSAQSEFAKYQTFYGFYSRCIIFVGMPYHNSHIQIQYKIKYLKAREHFRLQQALKNVTRCLSNCINNLDDSKLVIFADADYNRNDIKKKWFSFIKEGKLSTVNVLDHIIQINKNLSIFQQKRKIQEEKLKIEEQQRKQQNKADFFRRNSISIQKI